jgi:outer membrane scaffolding protein for murein synthesis (MipA/OmpV family)
MSAHAIDWTIGAGAGVAPDYEGSDDYQPVPLWTLRAQDLYHPATYVEINGLKLNSNLLPDDNFRLGLSGEYAMKRSDVEDDSVDSLGSTDNGLMLGIMGGYDFNVTPDGVLGLELDGRFDPKGDVGGLVTARVKYRSPVDSAKKWIFNARAESTFATDDYMENYFGIDAADLGGSNLTAFDADAGFKDVTLAAGITYMITQHWSVGALAAYKRLMGDAEDSPVTDDAGDADQLFAGILASFRF